MGRRKGLDFAQDAKRKRRRARIQRADKIKICFMVLLSLLVGILGFWLTKNELLESAKGETGEESITPIAGADKDSSTVREVAGPYGMWALSPTPIPTPTPTPSADSFMSDFVDTRKKINSKGIYLTSDGVSGNLNRLLKMIDETELNTMVIDIKDDDGRITYKMSGTLIDEFGTSREFIKDMPSVVKKLKEHNVYLIGRVVAFKDPLLVKTKPELALHYKDGTVYKDYSNIGWLDPRQQETLDYYVEIAQNMADMGFDEINFDYVRFPTEGKISELDLGNLEEVTKIDMISAAVKYLCEQIKPMGIFVSADVFGAVIKSKVDQRIVGQDYAKLSSYLDYICPMIYPSHYAEGFYGIPYPDTEPYKLIYLALLDSNKVLSVLDEYANKAIVRPWLQDFTASWIKHYIKYGPKEIRDQINATYDSGHTGWLLWNAAMNYTQGGLMTEEEAEIAYRNRPTPTPTPVPVSEQKEPTKIPNMGQYIDSPWKKTE